MRLKPVQIPGLLLGTLAVLLLALALVGDARYNAPLLYDAVLPSGTLDSIPLAPTDEALTFAQIDDSRGPRLLLVDRYQDGLIVGRDLSAAFGLTNPDPITLFNAVGYDAILQAATGAPQLQAAPANLLLPFTSHETHVAVGTNYPEHGDEVDVDEPLLFPKLGPVSHFAGQIERREALLDYEGELGLVLLADHSLDQPPPSFLGLILLNDVTDRERQVRGLNLLDIDSGAGFTDGKSRDGFLPIGGLLVIPRNWATFVPQLKLDVYVNGRLRQRAAAEEMIWAPEQIFRELAARRAWTFPYRGHSIPLVQTGDSLTARTIILTGTPAGVAFRPPTARQVIAGIPPYLLSLDWTTRSALDAYFAGAHASGAFLQPGDEVVVRADQLGLLQNRIVP